MSFLMKNGSYSWRRITLTLALLAVIAFSHFLKLPAEVVTALLVALAQAFQFFFQQHSDSPSPPPNAS